MNNPRKVTSVFLIAGILLAIGAGSVLAASPVVEKKVDSLFMIASSGSVKFRDQVAPAMDALAGMGVDAVVPLIGKLDTKSARERLTAVQALKKIGSPAVPDLLAALQQNDDLIVQRVCSALGEIKDTAAIEGLMAVADHAKWQVREQAIGALGRIGDAHSSNVVMNAMIDTIGQVRKAAAVSAGRLTINEAASGLVHLLGDEFYGARMSAREALMKLDTTVVMGALIDSIESVNSFVGDLACAMLGDYGTDAAVDLLLRQTKSSSADRRAHAAMALVKADPLDNCGYQKQFVPSETDRYVLLKIQSALHDAQNQP